MESGTATNRQHYTWDEYRTWTGERRWELIGGRAYAMTPAPTTRHQRIVGRLYEELARHFRGHKCEVFVSPVDVKLSPVDVVQPDVVVVCDPRQVKTECIEGPPRLVVEVLSPATALQDRSRKLDLYAKSRVREVWLVTPYPSLIEVYALRRDAYRLVHAYREEEPFASAGFANMRLDLSRVFDVPADPGEQNRLVKEEHPPYPVRGRKRVRALACAGRFSSGRTDISRRHDEHLASAYRP